MTSPLDDIAFLTRSPNRVAVLLTVAEGSHTRRELVDEVAASRVTVGRILEDFDERGWVQRRGTTVESTGRGRLLAHEVGSLRNRLRALDRLDSVIEWFPVDRLNVPLEGFVDAEVTVPTATQPNRHHRRIGTVGAEAAVARMYSGAVTHEAIEIHRTAVREQGQRLELLLTTEALEVVRAEPSLGEALRMLAAESVVAVVDSPLPVPFVGLFDGTCFIGATDDRGAVGVVETDSETVVDWAERTLDDLAARASRVDPESISD